jgi:glycosyltransferase involved in cell wall biosynthesis
MPREALETPGVKPDGPVVLDVRVVSGTGGGPEKTILNSPRFFAGEGYRMLCAYLHPPGDPGFEQLRLKARDWQAPLLPIPDRGPWDWTVLGELLRLCRRERVAIWHGHDYKSNFFGLILRPFWPMRLVTTVHGWVKHTRRTPLYYWVDRLCLPRYELVIGVSPDLVEASLACGTPPKRCVLIENGIDTEAYRRRRDAAEAKREFGVAPETFLIVSVGRLSEEKGFETLIRAVARLLREGKDVALRIAGEGDLQARLEALIAELGCSPQVRLLGYQADPRPLYEAADVFALASLREGLPNVLLEALAMEVPVVATRVAGIPRLIEDGQTGLLVEPGSEAGLAEALGRLHTDAGLRERLRQAGRHTVETRYSFAERIRKISTLYDTLLKRERVRSDFKTPLSPGGRGVGGEGDPTPEERDPPHPGPLPPGEREKEC